MERSSRPNVRLFWSVVLSIVLLDVVTKVLAVWYLPVRVPTTVLGEWFRLTLVYNRGAAFGLHLGHDSFTRIVFTILTLVALLVLWKLFRDARDGDRLRVLAVSLVFAGAIGNLIDRLRWSRGVVDFIDAGVGGLRWPTFNVADMAVTTGAITLAFVLWREEGRDKQEAPGVATPGAALSESSGESAV